MPIKGIEAFTSVNQRLYGEKLDMILWREYQYDLTKMTLRKKGRIWLMVVTVESEDGRLVAFIEDTTLDNCLKKLIEEALFNKQFKKLWHRSKY